MAAKTDFTPEEWDTLQKGVTGAGMMVSLADPGFFDSFKESWRPHQVSVRGAEQQHEPTDQRGGPSKGHRLRLDVLAAADRDRDDPGAQIVDDHAEGEGSRRCAGVSRLRAERGEVRRGRGERHRRF